MKVLYALYQPDALSETYIQTEMEWMEAQGVRVCVWAQVSHISAYPDLHPEKLVGGTLDEALQRFRPDLVHTHWLVTARRVAEALRGRELPLTVRGHSFEFKPEHVATLEAEDAVRRIWLFPHFIRPGMSDKTRPMTCCYNPRRYFPAGPRDRRRVVRATAGLNGKGLEEMLETAFACPDFEFVLVITRATHMPDYPDRLASLAPPNLKMLVNLQHDQAAAQVRASALCFRNHDPHAHPYGMPMSAAEAMACGSVVIARRDSAAEAYLGDAALYYDTVDGAADLLYSTLEWGEAEWERRTATSLARASRYTTDAVLPELLEEWKRLTA